MLLALLLTAGCGVDLAEPDEAEPELLESSIEQGLVTCAERQDTGYQSGRAFPITVVTADGKPVDRDTANAYAVMQQAAAAAGVRLVVVSGFRTMAEQQYLYGCYVNCSCNNCNLAARPGTSNHQSGHALDLNTSAPGVLNWLNANGGRFGFSRTVPSEPWHWEWWGGGPGGGPCGLTRDNCTTGEAEGCGRYGCGCVDHQCNGGFCPGSGCSAQHTRDCGGFGCGCVDGQCNGGTCEGSGCTAKETLDCARFGCGCVDHQCNGGAACPGTGCTWRETRDCGAFGVNCADHQCAGGYGPGSGCTGKETTDCAARGCGCVDHQCAGGSCQGSGCTARQTLDCQAFGQACQQGRCVAPPSPVDAGPPASTTPLDAGTATSLPPVMLVDAGAATPTAEPLSTPVTATPDRPQVMDSAEAVTGSCTSVPGLPLAAVALVLWRRRRVGRARLLHEPPRCG
jgi:hypothetical protein